MISTSTSVTWEIKIVSKIDSIESNAYLKATSRNTHANFVLGEIVTQNLGGTLSSVVSDENALSWCEIHVDYVLEARSN